MSRPAAEILSDREFEFMHVFGNKEQLSAQDTLNELEKRELSLTE